MPQMLPKPRSIHKGRFSTGKRESLTAKSSLWYRWRARHANSAITKRQTVRFGLSRLFKIRLPIWLAEAPVWHEATRLRTGRTRPRNDKATRDGWQFQMADLF